MRTATQHCITAAGKMRCDYLHMAAGSICPIYNTMQATGKTIHNTKLFNALIEKAGADPAATNNNGQKPKTIQEVQDDHARPNPFAGMQAMIGAC